jgi:peptide deformylase
MDETLTRVGLDINSDQLGNLSMADIAPAIIDHYRTTFHTTFTPGELRQKLHGKIFDTLTLVDQYDDVLKKEIPPYTGKAEDLTDTALNMLAVMIQNQGIGLAAPQVNLDLNMFVIGQKTFGYWVCINPEILSISDRTETIMEGCLSFPGLFLKIPRPYNVKGKFFDLNGKEHIVEFEGIWARAFLHEYEHLHGVVFTSKVSKLKLDMARRKIKR